MAEVVITFDAWSAGKVQPSYHKLEVSAPKFPIELQPISPRLVRTLVHPQRSEEMVCVQFSPDGERLLAGDYPGGVVQVWNWQTGEQLTKLETGYGRRGTDAYLHVSPDWKTVYVPQLMRTVNRVEKEGKKEIEFSFDGSVRGWDLDSGELVMTLRHDPPRGFEHLVLAPDGRTMVTFENVATQDGRGWEGAASLWDLSSKAFRPLGENLNYWAVYSADGSVLAAPAGKDNGEAGAIHLLDGATGEPKKSFPIEMKNQHFGYLALSPDASLLAGQVRSLDFASGEHVLKFWDVGSGREVASIEGRPKQPFVHMAFSPDGRTLAFADVLKREPGEENRGHIHLFDVVERKMVAEINLGQSTMGLRPTFSPDGKWLAFPVVQYAVWPPSRDIDWLDNPQPRILLIDVASGEVRETLVAPQGFCSTVTFRKDGKMLASGGQGVVLLWDLSVPPGEWAGGQ